MSARWSLVSKIATKARSSHSLSITDGAFLLVHGGELEPRKPVDSDHIKGGILKGSIHSFDLRDASNSWAVLPPNSILSDTSEPTAVPEARVGATTIWDQYTQSLYLWGGRGGIDMTPLDREQAGVWKGRIVSGYIEWERLIASNEDESPEPRSYHAAVSSQGKLYIHAGCPPSGRLSTLHSFDLYTKTWKSLASAPAPARGGTTLVVVYLQDEEGPLIIRFAGFAGYELGADHTLDIYTIYSNTWRSVIPGPDKAHGYPGPRSVHGFVSFKSKSHPDAIALLYHGERDASSIGHAGAGSFWDDVWLLEHHKSGEGDEQLSWKKVNIAEGGKSPEGRGWFPSAGFQDEVGETKVAMFGGLLSSNERSDELWVLKIE